MGDPVRKWVLDPDDPRAPSVEVWASMTPAERAEVLASLPSDFPLSEAAPPEGDVHFEAVARARDVLRGFFGRSGRRVWVANNLAVYYPEEKVFAPDVIAVVDVDLHPRDHWSVAAEGQGLDVVIEVLWSGRRKKDLQDNVARFARLGIPEYFVFDRRKLRLHGYRLPTPAARKYEPILPQFGTYRCARLGLDLGVEGDKLRFYVAGAPLPESAELIAQMDSKLSAAEAHAEEEARLREESERRLAEALAELEKLRGPR